MKPEIQLHTRRAGGSITKLVKALENIDFELLVECAVYSYSTHSRWNSWQAKGEYYELRVKFKGITYTLRFGENIPLELPLMNPAPPEEYEGAFRTLLKKGSISHISFLSDTAEHVTITVKLGRSSYLDLHIYNLDYESATGG